MTSDNKERISHKPARFSIWVKLFFALNLIALISFLLFNAMGLKVQSKKQLQEAAEKRVESVKTALARNPQNIDFTGKFSEKIRFTLDATDSSLWVHFNLAKATSFKQKKIARDALNWDIAIRKAKIISNGGKTNNKGMAAIAAMNTADFDSVVSVPPEKSFIKDNTNDNLYEPDNLAIDKWYEYDFLSHRLTSKKRVYVIKTTDGHYAKLQILNYYCGGAPGCYTLQYLYQGTGSNTLAR